MVKKFAKSVSYKATKVVAWLGFWVLDEGINHRFLEVIDSKINPGNNDTWLSNLSGAICWNCGNFYERTFNGKK
jgi:hypothetical protein